MTMKRAVAIFALLIAAAPVAFAQSLIKTVSLAQDQIGFVKSAMGITTRISFSEALMLNLPSASVDVNTDVPFT